MPDSKPNLGHLQLISRLLLRTVISAFIALGGCAQVPHESVELSTTLGRDLTEVHKSHRALAFLLFDRMKADVNDFVDSKYAPYQIGKFLVKDQSDFRNGDDSLTLFGFLAKAAESPDNQEAQLIALGAMQIVVEEITDSVEAFRNDLLQPLEQQEREVINAIDQSYSRILYANSIVTGHLSSVLAVHDAQSEILNQVGLGDAREKIGERLVGFSENLRVVVDKARSVESSMESARQMIKDTINKGIPGITNQDDEK